MCFFFNVTATTESYTDGHTLSLHDAFPILGASAIDLLLATGLVFGLSIVGVAGWALVRGVRLGMADGAATDPQQVAAQLGQPQGTTLVLISVLATASAAVALYFWRRPAGAGERAASHELGRASGRERVCQYV